MPQSVLEFIATFVRCLW